MEVAVQAAGHALPVYYRAGHHLSELAVFAKSGKRTVEELTEAPAIKYLNLLKGDGSIPKKSKLDKTVNAILTAESKGDPVAEEFVKKVGDAVIDLERISKISAVEKTLEGLGFSKKSFDFVHNKRARVNAALVLAMLGAHKMEKMNDMRDPSNCGTNTMCLYKHEWPISARAGFKENAKMSDDTEKLWIELEGSEEDGMFYLASPCKADLVVTPSKCKCTEYYDTSKLSSDFVIQEWGYIPNPYLDTGLRNVPQTAMIQGIRNTFNVPMDFPGSEEDGYTTEYIGPDVVFDYYPECEEGKEDTSECKPKKDMVLKDGEQVGPVMLEQALKSMNGSKYVTGGLTDWVRKNTGGEENPRRYTDKYVFTHRKDQNFEQATRFKKCIKGDWWEFWKGGEDVPCIKIEAYGYADYRPNFCYEKKWDKASKAEVGLFAVEVVAGVVAAVAGGAASGGAGAAPAYCIATTAVSAGGAWLLAGEMANDKWPNGINQ